VRGFSRKLYFSLIIVLILACLVFIGFILFYDPGQPGENPSMEAAVRVDDELIAPSPVPEPVQSAEPEISSVPQPTAHNEQRNELIGESSQTPEPESTAVPTATPEVPSVIVTDEFEIDLQETEEVGGF